VLKYLVGVFNSMEDRNVERMTRLLESGTNMAGAAGGSALGFVLG
jgi:hypothetical protein